MIAALVDHLWQSTLFALGAGALTLTLRRNGAGVRYGLWFAASVKFLVPFALLAAAGRLAVEELHLSLAAPLALTSAVEPLATPLAAAPRAALAMIPRAGAPATGAIIPLDPAPVLLAVWAIGLAVVLWAWAVRWSRLRQTLRAARPSPLPAPVPVLSTPAPMEPGVVGLLRPVLIVPEGIAERLSPAEWKAVLAHELCHIRRRDNLTGAIHMLAQALFWFHPLVWWLGARLVAERERACDEAVVRAGADGRTYAEGILKVCRLYLQQPLACAAGVSGADLKQRVRRILANEIRTRLTAPKKLMLAAAALLAVGAPLAAGGLASVPKPARAQSVEVEAPSPVTPTRPIRTPRPVRIRAKAAAAGATETRPTVMAAAEMLPSAPEIARAQPGEGPVAADLSQATPDLPVLDAAAPAEPDAVRAAAIKGQSAPPSASGGSTTTKPKAASALFALALFASPASFAQTTYVPPGPEPRFGGEFSLTQVGQVAGYWRSECYNWHVRSQSRRTGPLAPPPLDAAIKRFISGLIVEKPDYEDLSPAMAEAVRKNLPTYWPSINRMGHATVAKLIDTTKTGDQLYVVDQTGGGTHWNMIVNADGKIASAFMCGGQGL